VPWSRSPAANRLAPSTACPGLRDKSTRKAGALGRFYLRLPPR
jgi:hypothetical protein